MLVPQPILSFLDSIDLAAIDVMPSHFSKKTPRLCHIKYRFQNGNMIVTDGMSARKNFLIVNQAGKITHKFSFSITTTNDSEASNLNGPKQIPNIVAANEQLAKNIAIDISQNLFLEVPERNAIQKILQKHRIIVLTEDGDFEHGFLSLSESVYLTEPYFGKNKKTRLVVKQEGKWRHGDYIIKKRDAWALGSNEADIYPYVSDAITSWLGANQQEDGALAIKNLEQLKGRLNYLLAA